MKCRRPHDETNTTHNKHETNTTRPHVQAKIEFSKVMYQTALLSASAINSERHETFSHSIFPNIHSHRLTSLLKNFHWFFLFITTQWLIKRPVVRRLFHSSSYFLLLLKLKPTIRRIINAQQPVV